MSIDYGDMDRPEFRYDTYPRARKEHKCFECETTIKAGESYRRIVGKWCGEFDCFKICDACEDLRRTVEHHTKMGVAFGELFHMIDMYEEELPEMLIIALAAS